MAGVDSLAPGLDRREARRHPIWGSGNAELTPKKQKEKMRKLESIITRKKRGAEAP